MNVQHHKRTQTGWGTRLLNTAMLLILILGVMTPGGVTAVKAAQPAATTNPAPAAQTIDLPDWVFQGPAPQLNAQQDTVNVPQDQESVSGAVTAIAASPTDPNLVYIGSSNGGIWKSTNATDATPTWTPLTDNLPSQSIGIGALAFDPTDPTGNTLVAGTGQFSGYANRGDDLAGVYYSTDGGATWTTSKGTNGNLVIFSGNPVKISGVAVRGNTLLASTIYNSGGSPINPTIGGLFRTTNGPTGTWTQISGSGGLPNAAANFVVGDPANPNVLYVGFLGASGGIFKTTDLGATWTNVSSGINIISSSTTAFKAAVFNNGTTNVVTVVLNGTVNGADGNAIFRSVNGAAFTALDVPAVFSNAYGTYGVAVDKTNSDLVYVSGGYVLPGSGPFLASTARLDASKPNGSQLTLLYGGVSTTLSAAVTNTATTLKVTSTSGMPTTFPFSLTVDSEQMSVTAISSTTLTVTRSATPVAHNSGAIVTGYPTYGAPHVDVNYLATDAAGALLMGTHGSLFRLPDPANPPSATNYWSSKNGNLGVSEIHDIAYDHVTHTLMAGLQDNCVIYQNAPGSLAWSVGPANGDGGDVAVAEVMLPGGTPASTTLLFTQNTSWSDLYVASTDGFPSSGYFYVTADSEQMFVSAVRGAAYPIASATQSGSTVTITTAAPHGLVAGNSINIRGVSVSGYNSALVTVTAVPSSTTFTYTLTATGLAAATGGTASNLRLSVTRGVNGTTPATHNSGAAVSSQFLAQSVSVRYGSSQTLGSFKRQVFNASNVMLGSTSISTSVVTDGQFTTPVVVNAVNPNRLLIGGSANLYESVNMGDTIANIAITGVNSSPGPIAYGGYRNGVANPDVLYVGFGTKVYTRTAAGGAVTATAALPAGAGTLRRIAMNPADWMNAYAIDNDQVFMTTDGGATWSDITGGLFSSLSSGEPTALAFVSGPSPFIAVGTRSGVYASLLSNLGVWTKLGDSLPDVLVFELAYDATDDVLVAGTLGRSAWLLPNASAAFTPSSVAPVLSLSGPTTANEGSTQYVYSFTVTDPGDRFTVGSPTITGGSLVAGSLITTASGGSFKVTFADGPSTASISLQVTDSTGLSSNVPTTSVTVANVAPTATILGAPTSGAPGTTINLTNSVTDPSAADAAAGFTYLWFVYKPTGAASIPNSTGATFSYTPSITGTYTIYLNTTDKDGSTRQTSKVITAASPDLTEDNVTLTVFEGQPAVNSGTYANVNGNPLTLTASVGTLTTDGPLFADTFDSDPIAYTITSLKQWDVTQGNLDILGPGLGDVFPGNNNYLSMAGTENGVIQTKTTFDLTPGVYQLSFEYGTSPTGTDNQLRVTLGTAFDETFTPPVTTTDLVPVVRTIIVSSATPARLTFAETDANNDANGAFLDNVTLVRTSPVAGAWSWSYIPDDNTQSQDVTITATDTVNGEVTNISFPLTVENVDPTASFFNGTTSRNESVAFSVMLTGQSDPSTADKTAGFHYAYDFNNDGIFDSGDGTYNGSITNAQVNVPAIFVPDGPGSLTIRGRIIDKDGGYTDTTITNTITNTVPAPAITGPASALSGQMVSFVFGPPILRGG